MNRRGKYNNKEKESLRQTEKIAIETQRIYRHNFMYENKINIQVQQVDRHIIGTSDR